MPAKHDLTHGPVDQALVRFSGPMVLGIVAIILFNLVDAAYVGQLGAEPLAAMGFTVPIALAVISVSMGLGVGATSAVARSYGRGDREAARSLATHSLVLAFLTVGALAALGAATIDPLFTLLGADPALLPLIRSYLYPWYAGVAILSIPMMGNAVMRGTGDARTPASIMVIASVINLVLDPFLIFGLGPFPRLGLQGAAVVTVLAWVASCALALLAMVRGRLLSFARPWRQRFVRSCGEVLHVGLPVAGMRMLAPLSQAVLTGFIAAHGPAAVAAFGVSIRLEAFALVGAKALSSAVNPFAGQNHGAGHAERLEKGVRWCAKATVVYGLTIAAVAALVAAPLATLFSDDPRIIGHIESYLWIVPTSYTAYGFTLTAVAFFTGTRQPLRAVALSGLRVFVLVLPLAILGSRSFGVMGAFLGIAAGNALAGAAAWRAALRGVQQSSATAVEGA